jgi:PhoH-like ATPase
MPNENSRHLIVLDTNVLMHDPTAVFRFHEHDVFLPMVVLEELDAAKKGTSEVARNVRQVSRFLDELVEGADHEAITNGLELSSLQSVNGGVAPSGRLFLQTQTLKIELPAHLPGKNTDNSILSMALSLQETWRGRRIILVSKDINLRIKAHVLGINTEDYYNDKVLDDVDLLYTGLTELDDDFWNQQIDDLKSWQSERKSYYRIEQFPLEDSYPYQCLFAGNGFEALVEKIDEGGTTLRVVQDYRNGNAVWGINARNREQNFALNLLMDPEVDLVTLLGAAGTGKTLLALAAGLVQTMETKLYREIIITRVTVPVGEDIGFLPGTEEEKMAPWMGALLDNLEVLTQSEDESDWGRAATADLLNKRIKLRSLNFMRGRTFLNRYIIIDEAQNLTSKQMKTLITRAGPGSKIICLGNVNQIDTPYLTETTSGLTYVVDRFKTWPHSGHITLRRGERSRLADAATEIL